MSLHSMLAASLLPASEVVPASLDPLDPLLDVEPLLVPASGGATQSSDKQRRPALHEPSGKHFAPTSPVSGPFSW